jgi:hypothetical protein
VRYEVISNGFPRDAAGWHVLDALDPYGMPACLAFDVAGPAPFTILGAAPDRWFLVRAVSPCGLGPFGNASLEARPRCP